MENNALPALNQCFDITFDNQHTATAVRVSKENNAAKILSMLGLEAHRPCVFVSGGATAMTTEDRKRVEEILSGVAEFVEEHGAVIIDGGTEAGVMQMVGDARLKGQYTFPLIGVSPLGKVSYPGYKNPNEQAFLEDSHSHFVLVDGDEWGDESQTIVNLTYAICNKRALPSAGILINGGTIAMHEIYLASTTELKLPILVLEGSGRTADEISSAFRTGKTKRGLLRAILAGGDIQIVAAEEGVETVLEKLAERFTI